MVPDLPTAKAWTMERRFQNLYKTTPPLASGTPPRSKANNLGKKFTKKGRQTRKRANNGEKTGEKPL
jgi:hypothetical protein